MPQPEFVFLQPVNGTGLVSQDQESTVNISGFLTIGPAAAGQTIQIRVSTGAVYSTKVDTMGHFNVVIHLGNAPPGAYAVTAVAPGNAEYYGNQSTQTFLITCFCSGALIRTVQGDVAVEQLKIGDVVVTASGERRAIRWLGHRTVDCRSHPRPHDAQPIRVAAHAFGPGRPRRDLWLSPGHLVLVGGDGNDEGGHLVPIMCLVNGTTIERMPVAEVAYWHVELETHDILLAEGLPAESYLDWGDRAFFAEGADHALTNPDFVVPGLAGRCRTVAIEGPVVEAERQRLDAVFATRLAAACAWPGFTEDILSDSCSTRHGMLAS